LGNGANNAANKLILGTIATETRFGEYRDPTPFRAGSGLCQIDQKTFFDIKARTRKHNKDLILKEFDISIENVTYSMLEYNPLLSVMFCRLFYKLIPEEIENDIKCLSMYWKRYYNTSLGKGNEQQFIGNYNYFVKGAL
jgi:hypothetical protein